MFDYMNDGIRSELSGDFSLTQLFEPYRWQSVKAFMTYYPSVRFESAFGETIKYG